MSLAKKNLIIFGTGDIAQLAYYYFESDSDYVVSGFTVDKEYLDGEEFCGLPVVDFGDIQNCYPPNQFYLFIALSYAQLNDLRAEKYFAAKDKGYRLASYISSNATVLNNGNVGDNTFILEDNTLQPFSRIGNNVFMWSGNHLGHHSIIHDHCFIASHVVISGGVIINESCFVGVNATIRDHVVVGNKCIIGAASVILKNTDPEGIYKVPSTERSKVSSLKLKTI